MRTSAIGFLAAIAMLAMPAVAEGPKRDSAGRAEKMFQYLDKNHDGVLTADELPDRLKQRLPALAERVDKNKDKKIDKAEFLAAAKAMAGHAKHRQQASRHGQRGNRFAQQSRGRGPGCPYCQGSMAGRRGPGAPPFGQFGMHRRGMGGPGMGGPGMGGPGMGGPGMGGPGMQHPGMMGHPGMGAMGRFGGYGGPGFGGFGPGRFGPMGQGQHSPMGPAGAPNPKEMFAKLDRNHDGKLDAEEFAAGMAMFHHGPMGVAGPGAGPRPPMGPPPGASEEMKKRFEEGMKNRGEEMKKHVEEMRRHGHAFGRPSADAAPAKPADAKKPEPPKSEKK